MAGSGTLSKADCDTLCVGQLFLCVDNKCTASAKGLPQDTCEQNCGHTAASLALPLSTAAAVALPHKTFEGSV